ncbi:hypothetical protein RHGRI_020803 [Rhododendron griersonianum]|uniref:Putative plant transposon protein domain-containing protein n=1 Tax=Rhododendron griersonianum TaxID=479676 RepID=A0AAV6JKQ9_9ERIC|nr:hypothetical protein RHGRI_020803 [Rhododendron griersonianum]
MFTSPSTPLSHTHTSIKSSLSRIPLLFCPSSSLAPSDLTSTVYVRAALTSNTNDGDPISNALDPQPRFDDKKKGDTSRGPETETEYLSLGVMDTPNRSTNSNGVSYDWESNSESDSGPSTQDSHSNNFGGNDVEGEGEGEGSVSSVDDSLPQTARYGILSSGYNLMSFYASHGQDSFEDAREAEYEMTSWMRKRWERENNKDNKTDIGEASNGQLLFGVGDPLVHIAIMSTKRKNLDSASSPSLRRSKRLAALSVDQSSDGRDDDELNVPSGGDNEDMSTSISHADNDSDGDSDGENDGDNDGQSESDDESDGESESEGAIKLPNLSNFVSRPVIEERSVAIGKLKKITCIPDLLKDLGLNPICTYRGKANWTLVREFFVGIDPFNIDKEKRVLVSKVRGHIIKVTPDRLAQYKNIKRPLETEKQYPYLPGVEIPSVHDIWNTLCHGSWPADDNPIILLNGLKKDFVLLHHIFWWNVKPKSPRRELNANQAMLLHAVYNGFKPDIASIWWDTIYEAWSNNHPKASLPLGHLLTGFVHKGRKIPDLMQDKFGKEVTVIGRGTIGKSEGQSKLHRKAKNPATLEGIQDLLESILENQYEFNAMLKNVQRVVCPPPPYSDE